MKTKIILALIFGLALTAGVLGYFRRSQAATPLLGCAPGYLTVQTGQYFYFTVVVSDVVDLYAWQMDVTYNATYVEFLGSVVADHLRPSDSEHYFVPPELSSGLADNLALTRLGQPVGVDGSGRLVYLQFRALKDTSGTTVSLKNTQLVDRNALNIAKSLINSGYCRAVIRSSAPILVQPPLFVAYLPFTLR